MARKNITEMIDELRSWLPNYDRGEKEYPTVLFRTLAALPGGDELEDIGYEPLGGISWHEADLLGRVLETIQDKRDVEDLVTALTQDEENPEEVKARKPIQALIEELQSWLPNYDHGPDSFPTTFYRFLAAAPGGDRLEDMGYEPIGNLGWQELDQLGRVLETIQDKGDVEDLVQGLLKEEEEGVGEAREVREAARSADDRLFIGVFPTGLSYADKSREKHGDYAKCAFLSFGTLKLDIERDCPADLRRRIEADAAKIQARRGDEYPIDASGHTVTLGKDTRPDPFGRNLRPLRPLRESDDDERDHRTVTLYDDDAMEMMQHWWHGQGDPLYAIHSMGGQHEAWVFQDAISNLDSDLSRAKKIGRDKYQLGKGTFSKKDIDELAQIRDALQMALDDVGMQERVGGMREHASTTESHELALYTINDGDIYRRTIQQIILNLARKIHNGTYNKDLAINAWMYAADAGAKKYTKEFASDRSRKALGSFGIFTKSDRMAAAREIAEQYDEEVQAKAKELSASKNKAAKPRPRGKGRR